MAGLGLGSHLGGRLSERTGALAALRLFASVELAIGALRPGEPVPVLLLALPARRAPAEPLARGRARAPRRPAAPHAAHGHVAAAARARHAARRGDRGPHDRLSLRDQHARRRGRRLRGALAAAALGRDPGCGRGRRGRQPPRGPGRARPRPRRDSERDAARHAFRGAAARPRAPPVRPVALALRAVGLRGAVARDPVVPAGGRGREVDRVHLRHGARDLPAGLRDRLPDRGAARLAPAPAARDVPAVPVRRPARRGALRDRPHAPAARPAGLRLARRVLGHLPLLPLRARERARAGGALVRSAAALPVRVAHRADGLRLPGAAARRARRGEDAAGARWAPCRRRTSRAASAAAC